MMVEYREQVEKYLTSVFGKPVQLIRILEMGAEPGEKELKGFGYGKPYLIDYILEGQQHSAVLSSMRVQKGFGHDHFADRAGIMLWQNAAFNVLPKHVRSIDVGFFTEYGGLKSAGDADEFFILMDRIGGLEYYRDLDRIRDTGIFHQMDIDRAKALSDYLVYIHAQKHDDPVLYKRRIRELVGSGECIMGLDDSYPDNFDFYSRKDFERMEQKCVQWRWKLCDQDTQAMRRAWRFPPLEHHVPQRRRLYRAGPQQGRIRRGSRRCVLHEPELYFLFAAKVRYARQGIQAALRYVHGKLSGQERRSRYIASYAAVLRVQGARSGQPAVVSES